MVVGSDTASATEAGGEKRWLFVNGSLSGAMSKALCQGSTFSLACHESEAGSGGCVRGYVRQQVQLGLPRQEVGRACVSYLIYGRAAGTLPVQMKKRKEQEGKGGGQLPLHPKCRPAGTLAV